MTYPVPFPVYPNTFVYANTIDWIGGIALNALPSSGGTITTLFANALQTVTQANSDSTSNVATTAFVQNALASAPTSNSVTVNISGDATGSGSGNTVNIALTLVNTTVVPGTYGSATQTSQVVLDSKGRVLSATNVTITTPGSIANAGFANVAAFAFLAGQANSAVIANTANTAIFATTAGQSNSATVANTVNSITGSQVITALGYTPGTSNATNTVAVAITGDGTGSGFGNNISIALTLSNTAVAPGTYGSNTQVAQVVVDSKGRVLSASNIAIAFPAQANSANSNYANIAGFAFLAGQSNSATVSNTVNSITGAQVISALGYTPGTSNATNSVTVNISGDATGSASGNTVNIALTLANTTVVPGTYGSATQVGVVVVDSKGRVTSVSNVTITTPGSIANAGFANIAAFAFLAGQANSAVVANTVNSITGAQVISALGYTPGTSNATNSVTVNLSGDATGSASGNTVNIAVTLANTSAVPGTYGSGTQVSTVTVNAKGLVTSISNTNIVFPSVTSVNYANYAGSALVATTANIAITQPLTDNTTNIATTMWVHEQGYITNSSIPTSVANASFANVANIANYAINAGQANSAVVSNSTNSVSYGVIVAGLGFNPGTSNATNSVTVNLSGDATGTGFGNTVNIAVTLANTAVVPGTYGSATQVATVTVDSKGRVVSASNIAILFPAISNSVDYANYANIANYAISAGQANSAVVANTVNSITSSQVTTALGYTPQGNFVATGDVSGTATLNAVTLTLASVNANIGSFGGSITVPVITTNPKGLITAISNVSIAFPAQANSVANATFANFANVSNYSINSGQSNNAVTANYANYAGSALVATTANIAVTQPLTDNTTNIATTAWVQGQGYGSGGGSGNTSVVLVGDVLATGNTGTNIVTTLSNVNSNIGTFGGGTTVASVTVNAKGLVTAVSNIAIVFPAAPTSVANATFANTANNANYATTAGSANSAVVANTVNTITSSQIISALGYTPGTSNATNTVTINLSGDATGSATGNTLNVAVVLVNVNSNIGSYGGSLVVPVITTNAKGLITAISNVSIAFPSAPTSVANATFANTANNANFSTTATYAQTQTASDNSTFIATTAFVQSQNYGTSNATNSVTVTLSGDVSGSGSGNSVAITATLANTAVAPGTYTLSTIIVDSKGRITNASSGTGGGGSSTFATTVVAQANIVVTNTISLTSATNTTTQVQWQNGTNNLWQLGTITNQSTGNLGGNLTLIPYTDAGVAGTAAFTVYRSNGVVAFGGAISHTTPSTADNSTLSATTAYVKAQSYVTGGPYLPTGGGTVTGYTTFSGTGFLNSTAGMSIGGALTIGSSGVTWGSTSDHAITSNQTNGWTRWVTHFGDTSDNWRIDRYTGATTGTLVDSPLTINRTTGLVQVCNSFSANGVTVNGANASTTRVVTYQSNGVNRFIEGLSNTAEAAGNTNIGSNWTLTSVSDNAVTNTVVITAYRSNGLVAIPGTVTTVTQPSGDNSTNVATTAFVTTAVAGGGGGSNSVSSLKAIPGWYTVNGVTTIFGSYTTPGGTTSVIIPYPAPYNVSGSLGNCVATISANNIAGQAGVAILPSSNSVSLYWTVSGAGWYMQYHVIGYP